MKNVKKLIPIILIVLIIAVSLATFAWFTIASTAVLDGVVTADSSITVEVATGEDGNKTASFLELNGNTLSSYYNGQKGGASTGGDTVYTMRLDLGFYADGPQNLAVKLSFDEIIVEVSAFFTDTDTQALEKLFGITEHTDNHIGNGAAGIDNLVIDDSNGYDYIFTEGGGNHAVKFVRIPATLASNYFHIISYSREQYNSILEANAGAPNPFVFSGTDEFIVPNSNLSSVKIPTNIIQSTHVIFFEPENSRESDLVCPLSDPLFTNSRLRFKFVLSGRNTTEVAR